MVKQQLTIRNNTHPNVARVCIVYPIKAHFHSKSQQWREKMESHYHSNSPAWEGKREGGREGGRKGEGGREGEREGER